MCGIAGILQAEPRPFTESLRLLQQALHHRGPDDAGLWESRDGCAGLVHTRLAILDISAAGHQPMKTMDGRYVIVFNGEIYNYRALRSELEREGCAFQTQTDTEVLLHLYARYGADMVQRLRGMFAFVVWDTLERYAFFARDPFGIKPLYYAQRGSRLAFASELRALQTASLTGSRVSPVVVMGYLETGSVPEPHTLLEDVHCLEAGACMTWQQGKLQMWTDWRVQFPCSDDFAQADAPALTRHALLESLERHFVSDVPVGVFLSGGIDSTVLVALARELGHEQLATFSIGVDDAALDESSVAAQTARHFQTEHHEQRLTHESGEAIFADFLRHGDQPSIDGFNTFTVSAFAWRHGMKVVLSGLGGDELFGGYPSFQQVPRMLHLGQRLQAVPGLATLAGSALSSTALPGKWRRLGGYLKEKPTLLAAYRRFRGIFSASDARRLTTRLTGCLEKDLPELPHASLLSMNDLDAVSECELRFYMRQQLLKDSDVMSMAHGLELRVPLVDRGLFDTVSRVPAAVRLRAGKQLLLEAVPEVPSWVAQQPKRGFRFPFDQWLEASWGGTFRDSAARHGLGGASWYQRWSVFMLERWMERSGT